MSQTKKWGDEDFWGLGYEWDPQWVLTDKQKELQTKLIELARTTLRDNAVESDKKLLFPRKNFEALAKLGLLGLIVPKELGGMGENHVCAAMVVETIARYGCPSTAMCYTMHIGAVAAACLRYHDNETLKRHPQPPRQGCLHRHPLLLRPGDRIAFLVPDLLGRREGRGRLEGAQEGLLDHLRRLRRLVHHPDHQPGFRRQLRRSLLLADHGQ